jgi:predicted nucleic acid-binding protein
MAPKYKKSPARNHWQVQEAKARFSELFRTARTKGPQRVAHHGKEAVVVLIRGGLSRPSNKKSAPRDPCGIFCPIAFSQRSDRIGSEQRPRPPGPSMSGFLLDTNVISELVKPKPHPHVVRWVNETDEDSLFLSVLTLGKIRQGVALLPQGRKEISISKHGLNGTCPNDLSGRILSITDRIADRWGLIGRAGKKSR